MNYMQDFKKQILVIDDTGEVSTAMREAFSHDEGIELICSSSRRDELRGKLRHDIYVIYIHHDGLLADMKTLVEYITAFLNSIKPVLIAFSSDEATLTSVAIPGVGFVPKPLNIDVLHSQALNAIDILSANRSINDLSHLPGKYAIDAIMQDKIQKGGKFVLVLLDIDKFKPFTNYYGLFKANLVITFLANVLRSVVAQFGKHQDFIGHLDSDDYILILNEYGYEETIGQHIIGRFEEKVKDFYTAKDWANGYIEVLNLKGVKERFGPITLSLASVSNEHTTFKTTEEVFEKIMLTIKKAKQIKGSVMLSDTSNEED